MALIRLLCVALALAISVSKKMKICLLSPHFLLSPVRWRTGDSMRGLELAAVRRETILGPVVQNTEGDGRQR